jgi:hypothetical protein
VILTRVGRSRASADGEAAAAAEPDPVIPW